MASEAAIRCFLTLMEEGSFRRTAEKLNISQQAVSKHIQNMESELGYPLFIRGKRFVDATSNGERLYVFLKKYKEEFERLVQESRQSYASDVPTINIALLEMLSTDRIFSRFIPYNAQSPLFLLKRVHTQDLCDHILDGTFDAGFCYEDMVKAEKDIEYTPLYPSRFCLCVSSRDPRVQAGAGVEAFKNDMYYTSHHSAERRTSTIEQLERFGLEPKKIVYVPSVESVAAAIEAGKGVSVFADSNCICTYDTISCYPLDFSENVVCAWRRDSQSPGAMALLKLLNDDF